MNQVEARVVTAAEAGLRLDRWFRRHFPALVHGRLEKLLRTGQIRVDGARVKASLRLAAGQAVRVPPLDFGRTDERPAPARPALDPEDARALLAAVIYRDADVIAINKPSGLATQGGSGQRRHLDAMLDALSFGAAERPRLVHRLDKDTSGVLLLARSAAVAAALVRELRVGAARKLYWALTVGVPTPRHGLIDRPLAKIATATGERISAAGAEGKAALTLYAVLETAGKHLAWLALMPLTGRTHQLRAHCLVLRTPIQGDGKYGGARAFLGGGIAPRLHLHARRLVMPHPRGGTIDVAAPLPPHMAATWRLLAFDADDKRDPFPAQPRPR